MPPKFFLLPQTLKLAYGLNVAKLANDLHISTRRLVTILKNKDNIFSDYGAGCRSVKI